MSGKVAAFAKFGVKLHNVRWSWSGRTDDGQVVLLLWKDIINYKTKPPTYSDFDDPKLESWKDRPGNKERLEHLKWARDHCGGVFSVVIGVAKDVTADPRETAESYPTKIKMRLLDLNEETGEYRAEMIEQ